MDSHIQSEYINTYKWLLLLGYLPDKEGPECETLGPERVLHHMDK